MTPSQQCKQAGLKSLAELIKLSGQPKQTLIDWHKTKPRLFELVLKGVVSDWISVTDRMPEISEKCLILMEVDANIERGVYLGDGDWSGNWLSRRGRNQTYKVTHWMPMMPLPEPPK